MNVSLVPCPACARHVRQGDSICPFCGAKAAFSPGAPIVQRGRMSRAAMFAAGAAGAALAMTDCSSNSQPLDGGSGAALDASNDATGADAAQGAPDAAGGSSDGTTGSDDGSTRASDASTEVGSIVALYGAVAPPRDGSTEGG